MKYREGYIALLSVLIISAVMVIFLVGGLFRSTGVANMRIKEEAAARAHAAATACAEHALLELLQSTDYQGDEMLSVGEETCQVLFTAGSGNANRKIFTRSTVLGAVWKIEIHIDTVQPDLSIDSWHDVLAFTGGDTPPPNVYDWPNAVVASTINLPGGADALAVAAVGTTAYIGRKSSGDPEFYIVDASNALYPVTLGTLNLADDILGIAVTGTYAYLASKANSAELMVVNISNPTAPSLTTSLDLINNGDARRLAIKGNRLYLIRDNKGSNPTFYVFDISTPSSPVSLGSVFIGGGLDVATSKVGTEYAYIASETDTQELQAVNVTTPASMLVNGSADLISNNDAYAIAVSGTYAYVGTEDRGGDPEFFVMDISTPTSPSVVNTLNTEELFSVRAANGYVYLGGKANPPEIRIVDATNPLSLTTVASFDTSGNILDMAVTYNRLFAVSKGEPELVIIVPPKF